MEDNSTAVISSLIIDLFELINENDDLNTNNNRNNNNPNEDRSTSKLIELLRASLGSLDNNNNDYNTEDNHFVSTQDNQRNEFGYTEEDRDEAVYIDDIYYYTYSNILMNRTFNTSEYYEVISRIVLGLPLTDFTELSDINVVYVRELRDIYLIKIEAIDIHTSNYFFIDKDDLIEINEEESRTQEELNDIIIAQFRRNNNNSDENYEDDYDNDEDDYDDDYNHDEIARLISEDEFNVLISNITFTDRSNLSIPIQMSSEEEEE